MYNKQQIAYLLRNGFTIDEIMQTDGVQPAQDPAPAPAPAPAPEMSAGERAILAALDSIRAAYQAENRSSSYVDTAQTMTAEQALACATFGNKI